LAALATLSDIEDWVALYLLLCGFRAAPITSSIAKGLTLTFNLTVAALATSTSIEHWIAPTFNLMVLWLL
jgi:hypothetical protein